MNKEQAIAKLKEIQNCDDGDRESWHRDADIVLCELLTSLGYEDVVTEWYKVLKWYA